MSATYFHVSDHKLRLGAQLTQGIYGEKLLNPDFRERNYNKYIKEMIFEEIRQQLDPALPSRLSCIFLLPEIHMAHLYRATRTGYDKGFIYEVEVVDARPLVVEMDLLYCDGADFETIKRNAQKYWKQVHHRQSYTLECLLEGRAFVRQIVTEPSTL